MNNPELEAARSTVPDIVDAQRRLDAAKALLDDLPRTDSPEQAREAVLSEAAGAFMADKPWPKDIGKRVAKAVEEAEAADVEFLARKGAVTRAEWALYEALYASTEDVLTSLGVRLAELLDEARSAFTVLRGVNSAEAAIGAGDDAVAAWTRLRGIVQSVGDVRGAQWEALKSPKAPGEAARGDWDGRKWLRQGFGHVKGTHPDNAPDDVKPALRDVSGHVDVAYVRWLAAQEDAYVPTSIDELEGDVAVLTVPDGMSDWSDISPRVYPPSPSPKPAGVFPHSTTPHLDYSQPKPPASKPTAMPGDPVPPTYNY
ncbi:hypothetical protein [Streptomyces sp. NPDC059272]|uniref:hypothetical protein n=1 Tax=Streptomyces sp. NPDC059272 TaxID=3346800 RepID=UPI0036B0261D